MTIASHTIVKNGMPFIDLVLRQVIPYVDKSLITISEKSDDGTLGVLKQLKLEYPEKVFIDFENVSKPGDLTQVRQEQVDKTTEDWILFLDDDDMWSRESLEVVISMLDEDVDAFAVNPFQLLGYGYHDWGWRHKWFTKWFKNENINYRGMWPRDLIYKGDNVLYWKKNTRVKRIEPKFFHMSEIKGHSFRDEDWAKTYRSKIGQPKAIPEGYHKYLKVIYECKENK